jgi:ribosomal protein L31
VRCWKAGERRSSHGHGGVVDSPNTTATATIDDDGNAVFVFAGSSCAAGSSQVIVDVLAGIHPTYTTTFTVLPPQPTI